MEAREGEHSALVAKQLSNRHPLRAISSMRGVWLTTDPYTPIECDAWSSVKIITTFGRLATADMLSLLPEGACGCITFSSQKNYSFGWLQSNRDDSFRARSPPPPADSAAAA